MQFESMGGLRGEKARVSVQVSPTQLPWRMGWGRERPASTRVPPPCFHRLFFTPHHPVLSLSSGFRKSHPRPRLPSLDPSLSRSPSNGAPDTTSLRTLGHQEASRVVPGTGTLGGVVQGLGPGRWDSPGSTELPAAASPGGASGNCSGAGRARPLLVSSTHSLCAHSTEVTLRTRESGRKSSCWAPTGASYGSGGTVALVWLGDSPGHTLPLACPTLRHSQGLHTAPALGHTPTRVLALPATCH